MISNPILRQAVTAKDKQGISLYTETYDYIVPDQIIDMLARGVAYRIITKKENYVPVDNHIIHAMTKVVKNV